MERAQLGHRACADESVRVALERVVEHHDEGGDEPTDRDRDGGHHHEQQTTP
jgi:hypothetical protein